MAIDKNSVEYVAHLARIELQSKELEKLSSQLKDILSFIDKLNRIDTARINPTSHILPISNVLRQDQSKDSLAADKALENAPKKQGDFFSVPKVIE
ncbi:MAG: Asp-tRNA(Asn)/Glu-tRNA(Gln) amidotransferase subunit GatC [Candidatus Omnitrophica bacterium]|nr:Asp-tRNA(Asn)/Glu-tRNA(Gln) amidotransferase subunit GatC [Candidatus Omnitrophota bacterium]